ncbi:MAG: hypothetical protein IPI45_05675 [Saprospiraceae bacterium]|nr:hypothetical protein [Saprospiraceae bacterium]MBK7737248.1 hypothetical protein [Saprospiraceae bacterium]
MKNIQFLWNLYFSMLIHSICFSQSLETEAFEVFEGSRSEQIEKLNDQSNEKSMEAYIIHPLELNHCDFESILSFPLFEKHHAELVIAYLKIHRPLKSVYELQTIEGLPLDILKYSLPYLILRDSIKSKKLIKIIGRKDTHKLILRWGRSFDASDSTSHTSYLGSPDKFYCRYKSSIPGRYAMALTFEKDAGEVWIQKNGTKGFDYTAAYLEIEHLTSRLKKIILGDYQICIGQGLLVDNSFSIENGDVLASGIKRSGFLKPYQSIRESDMLRGIGMNLQINHNTYALLYFSSVRQDAKLSIKIDPTRNDTNYLISSILTTSYHRDSNELESKNTAQFELKGMSLISQIKSFKIGLNGLFSTQQYLWDHQKRLDRSFLSTKNQNFQASIDHSYLFKNISLYGEIAMDQNNQRAWMESMVLSPSKNMEVRIHYHHFDRGNFQYYSNTNSNSGMSFNEKSLQISWSIKPNARWNIIGNAHFTAFPWLRYQESLRTNQCQYFLRISCSERKKWSAYLLFQSGYQEQSSTYSSNKQNELTRLKNFQMRANIEMKTSTNLSWRSRIELRKSEINMESGTGFLISTDFLYKNIESKISGNIRYAVYNIPAYENRIYSFQNDVSGVYNLAAYSGKGYSIYLNVRWRITGPLMLEGRWSGQFKQLQDKENGISKTQDVKIQVQFKF